MDRSEYEHRLKRYMAENKVAGEHLSFEQSCHSVAEAAEAANVTPEDFIKSICMLDQNKRLLVAIVKGEDKVSTSQVAQFLNCTRPRLATPEESLTGYPCGGTPGFGYEAKFLIDPRVMEMSVVYSGGGSENSLVKISPQELKKANNGEITKVSK